MLELIPEGAMVSPTTDAVAWGIVLLMVQLVQTMVSGGTVWNVKFDETGSPNANSGTAVPIREATSELVLDVEDELSDNEVDDVKEDEEVTVEGDTAPEKYSAPAIVPTTRIATTATVLCDSPQRDFMVFVVERISFNDLLDFSIPLNHREGSLHTIHFQNPFGCGSRAR
jgi:hypothetical protein